MSGAADFIRELAAEISELLFPSHLYCISCRRWIDEGQAYRLCDHCLASIRWATGRTCEICGKVLSEHNPLARCYSCREHPHRFRKGMTCAEYGPEVRSLLFAFKYHGRSDLAETMGEIAADRWEASGEEEVPDLVVPIPLHPKKKRKRGYNQAGLFARAFAKRRGFAWDEELLQRTRETAALRGLSPNERKTELEGSFRVRPGREEEVRGRMILVVDDIYTTGATMDEAARALLEAGASEVRMLTFAAGGDVVKAEE